MTENENETPVRRPSTFPNGSGAMLGRFLAVGLFIALGTFAVIQSLSGAPKTELVNNDDQSAAPDAEEEGINPSEKITPRKKTDDLDVSKALANNKSKASLPPAISGNSNKIGQSKNLVSKTFKPATQELSTENKSNGTFESGGTFSQGPATNSKTLTSPAVSPSPFRASPMRKPPERTAQLPTGSARSTFNTGGIQKPLGQQTKDKVAGSAESLGNKINDVASKTKDGFSQLGQTLKDTTSDASSRVKNAFGSGAPARTASSSNPLKKIEAKPTIDSLRSRPFGANQPATRSDQPFQSQSLNPMSKASTQQTRPPITASAARLPGRGNAEGFATKQESPGQQKRTFGGEAQPRQVPVANRSRATFPPVNNRPAMGAASDPISPRPVASNSGQARTQLPSATTKVPTVKAGYVSPKPGDRRFEGVQAPALTIQKSSPREIQVNQVADFTVKIKNMGRVAVDDVMVVDQVPSGAEFIDANPKPTNRTRTGELRWQLGTMKPGDERTILLQLKPTVAGEIGSVAQFYFGGRASNRTKVTQPKLKIVQTADPKVLVGNQVVFDVTVQNTGNGPAKDVVIQEEVPELLEYQDGSRELEYEIGTLMPGQSRRVQLGLRAGRVGRLRNVMFASASGGIRTQHEVNVEIIAPKLAVSSEGPTRRFIQRKVSHEFTVANNGTANATNLQLVARLPSGLRYVNANNRGRYDRNAHAVIWQMRDLSAGGSGTVEITTTPIEAGQQDINFEVVADLGQKAETVQNLSVEHLIDVFFDIDDVVDPIEIGADTRYRIRMINQGTQAAANVQLQVDFPPGLKPTSVDSNLRNQIQGQKIVFEPITSLRPGEELNVTVQATGETDGDHRVVVNMRADGRAPVSKEETTRVYPDR